MCLDLPPPSPPLPVEENIHFVNISKSALKTRKADPGKERNSQQGVLLAHFSVFWV